MEGAFKSSLALAPLYFDIDMHNLIEYLNHCEKYRNILETMAVPGCEQQTGMFVTSLVAAASEPRHRVFTS